MFNPNLTLVLLSIFFHSSCSSSGNGNEGEPVVKVGDKILYSSVINQLVTEGTNTDDSTSIVSGYIENWVRDNLIIQEAEKNIPSDLNLNKLVNEYRSSLLMYHYENQLLKSSLDTIVTDVQKKDFYDEYGSQFILSHKIVQAIVVKSKESGSSFASWAKNQNNQDKNDITQNAKSKKYNIILAPDQWIPLDDLDMFISEIDIKKCKSGYSQIFTGKNGNYFIKIFSLYNENEIPPLDYIEEKIEQVMLNKRKTELLKSVRENLYKKNIKNRNITYFN